MNHYDVEAFSGIHVVRLTFMYENYVGHVSFKIGGNCHGKTILQAALDFIFEECNYGSSDFIENDCQLEIIESPFGDQFRFTLASVNGAPPVIFWCALIPATNPCPAASS